MHAPCLCNQVFKNFKVMLITMLTSAAASSYIMDELRKAAIVEKKILLVYVTYITTCIQPVLYIRHAFSISSCSISARETGKFRQYGRVVNYFLMKLLLFLSCAHGTNSF